MPSLGLVTIAISAACVSWGAEDCALSTSRIQTDTPALLQKSSQVDHRRVRDEEPTESSTALLQKSSQVVHRPFRDEQPTESSTKDLQSQATLIDKLVNDSSAPPNILLQGLGLDLRIGQACLQRFSSMDLKLVEALDLPWLMCLRSSELKTNINLTFLDIGQNDITFPQMHVEVDPDPNRQRAHIFTMGPESSGTCFVREYVAAVFGHVAPKSKSDYIFFPQETAWHISIPEGSYCEKQHQVPILDDFGGTSKELLEVSMGEGSLRGSRFPLRYILNITSMVKNYRARHEKVVVFQVARNPGVSLLSKKLRRHCGVDTISRLEQSLAFDIMLEAMNMEEVTTICYEQMLSEGASYLNKKLSAAGLEASGTALFPAVYDPSTKALWQDDIECSRDVKAYMKLCPDSPDAKTFFEHCSA